MAGVDNTKERLLYTWEILKKFSDENHLISVNEIIQKLKSYGIEVDRRAIYRDLRILQKFGVEERNKKYFYGEDIFEDIDYVILVQAIAELKAISLQKTWKLINNVKKLVSVYKAKEITEGIVVIEGRKSSNNSMYYILNEIRVAINERKKISFYYGQNDRQYILSPYKTVLVNEYYYLIGNYDSYDNLSHYRLDKIQNVKILEEKAKPLLETSYQKKELDLKQYLETHYGMFAGTIEKVVLKCEYKIIDILKDEFGSDLKIIDKQPTYFLISMQCVLGDALKRKIISFADYIKVVEPVKLRDEINTRLRKIMIYQENDK